MLDFFFMLFGAYIADFFIQSMTIPSIDSVKNKKVHKLTRMLYEQMKLDALIIHF